MTSAQIRARMKHIEEKAAALYAEIDEMTNELSAYIEAKSPLWRQGDKGERFAENLQGLMAWADYIQEIGRDSLIWEGS